MGLEKILPKLAEVEVMLRLLPASATGQRLTALVHFIQGLKVNPQGQQAFYLVILDNGRRRLAADPEMNEALYCLRCGACLNICPVFQVGAAHLYGRVYPGAIGILLAPYLAPVGDICDLCTQCGACQEVCPVGIRLREKIQVLRIRSRRFRPVRGLSAAAGAVLSHPSWYRKLEPAWRGLAGLLARRGWGRGLPGFSQVSFHRQQHDRQAEFAAMKPLEQYITAAYSKNANPSHLPFAKEENLETHQGRKDESVRGISLLAQRLKEAGTSLLKVHGPAALARCLAGAPAPLWLEDHPWLRRVARELERLGVRHHIAQGDWTPKAGTAVSVGLGAIPETGSVLVDSSGGPAAFLAFRAVKQIVLISPDKADLSLSQALKIVQDRRQKMVSWLTGPSRTADIEKVLVLGAQGPASLDVILYREEK
jgi:L-lactate dehydrogenase complex protein LldF